MKICLVRNDKMGDMILTLPVVQGLKQANQDCKIDIVCSKKTVDCYNPKVVQSSMGSLARINIFYEDLNSYLSKVSIPVYGTFLKGESVNRVTFPSEFVLIFGNESNGISKSISKFVSQKITIPKRSKSVIDSLNITSATAIVMNKISNQSFKC